MLIGMHKMIPIEASNLVPGKRYYIQQILRFSTSNFSGKTRYIYIFKKLILTVLAREWRNDK